MAAAACGGVFFFFFFFFSAARLLRRRRRSSAASAAWRGGGMACRSATAAPWSLVNRGAARVVCRKEGIHPPFFKEAEVFCNGELVMKTGGTQEKYVVDVWSGNHPFYQGNSTTLVTDADRVDKFKQRYGAISGLGEIPILTKGEIRIEKKKGPAKKGGKK
eukprot:SM000107S14046  [mRNA]  locus=s107:138952:139686:- [translate_table: standard]